MNIKNIIFLVFSLYIEMCCGSNSGADSNSIGSALYVTQEQAAEMGRVYSLSLGDDSISVVENSIKSLQEQQRCDKVVMALVEGQWGVIPVTDEILYYMQVFREHIGSNSEDAVPLSQFAFPSYSNFRDAWFEIIQKELIGQTH